MSRYYILYGSKSNLDYDLDVVSRPVKPSAEIEYEEKPVPGGQTLYVKKYPKDIEIPVKFNFLKASDEWEHYLRIIKRWLYSNEKTLKFSDDLEVFYNVKKVKIDTPERAMKKLGRFTVTFTCEPYVYYCNGANEIELYKEIELYNDYDETRPVFRVVGEGLLKLTINNKIIVVNVGQELIIDTAIGKCYRKGIESNVSLKGSYTDLYLKEGVNTFSWQGNFNVYVKPNWRCLS